METRVIVAHELRVQSPPTCPYGFVAKLDQARGCNPRDAGSNPVETSIAPAHRSIFYL